jgi:hypothetical protein
MTVEQVISLKTGFLYIPTARTDYGKLLNWGFVSSQNKRGECACSTIYAKGG